MRLLVLGANGLLGSRVVTAADTRDWGVAGTYHTEEPVFDVDLYQLDIQSTDRFEYLLQQVDPRWVVNCAAMTDVDACEREPENAHAINARAPGDLAAVCRERDIQLAHISTDYVFDGEADRPYPEGAGTGPIQTYGESKLAGERAVREACESALILRLSFVYGLHEATGGLAGFPAWVRDELKTSGETPLFTDQYVTPTRTGQAATVLCSLVDANTSGTYHVASRSCVTPYAFGQAVRKRMSGPAGKLLPGSMTETDLPARRPRYTCLDVSKIETELGEDQPTLEADLDAIARAL